MTTEGGRELRVVGAAQLKDVRPPEEHIEKRNVWWSQQLSVLYLTTVVASGLYISIRIIIFI